MTAPNGPEPTALTAADVAAACRALSTLVRGARVEDVAVLEGTDDLLLFLRLLDRGDEPDARTALQVAVGGRRGRVTTTRRRFPRHRFVTGPRVDTLRRLLVEGSIDAVAERPGDRACTIRVLRAGAALTIHAELHGARGLWAICTEDGGIRALSRLPGGLGARLRPG
ncbi:MAG: hypothetical protein O3B85_12830, partial [Planctomycetota bacterium]|nr:hypothetical protein [Planctomycetota bacterium]